MSDERKRRERRNDSPDTSTIDTDSSDSLQQNPTKPPRRRFSERGVGSQHARRPPTPDSSPTSKTRF